MTTQKTTKEQRSTQFLQNLGSGKTYIDYEREEKEIEERMEEEENE